MLFACVALAVIPDLDYLLWWVWQYRVDPRLTHSLGFSSLLFSLAYVIMRCWLPPTGSLRVFLALFLASFSHLLMDALVGVYPTPWLWPVSAKEFLLPFGILPSAGALAWDNVYMWRNILLEMGVLLPAFWLLSGRGRNRHFGVLGLLLVALLLFSLRQSIALPR